MSSYESTDAFLKRKYKEEAKTKLEYNVEDLFVLVERLTKKVDELEDRLDKM